MFSYLIRWFSRYQLIGFAAGLAIVVISFGGAAGLGLPALFWCREWYGLLLIGITVAGFFALCSFIGFLLDHEKLRLQPVPRDLEQYVARTIWLPSLLVVAAGLWRQFISKHGCGSEWIMLAGYGVGLLLVRYVVPRLRPLAKPLSEKPWFARMVNWLASRRRKGDERDEGDSAVSADTLWLHAYALILILLLVAIYLLFAATADAWEINAAISICILLALIVLFYGAVRFYIPRAMLLVVVVLLIWISLANQLRLKHRYEELKQLDTVDLRQHDDTRRNPALVPDAEPLARWRAGFGAAKPKLIVVMTSGGGIRASVWTAAVLHELDRARYADHIRVITGASGGMVGAGYWVTRRAFPTDRRKDADECEKKDPDRDRVRARDRCDLRGVTSDALDNVTKYLALHDVPALFLPARIPDRGFALEQAWKENAPSMKRTFDELRTVERTGRVPSLIYSPASLDDGRRMLVSNLQLDYMTRHTVDGTAPTRSAVQFFEIFPKAPLTVATAARMSASFPWVSSAAELPTEQLRRLGDAGYFDNFGGFVTSAWLLQNRKWLSENTSGVLVIQVRDSSFGASNRNIASVPLNEKKEPKCPYLSRGFSEFLAPVTGVIAARNGITHYRNDFDLAGAALHFPDKFLQSVEIELDDTDLPLTWNLTKTMADTIIAQAPEKVARAMAPKQSWWRDSPD